MSTLPTPHTARCPHTARPRDPQRLTRVLMCALPLSLPPTPPLSPHARRSDSNAQLPPRRRVPTLSLSVSHPCAERWAR